MEHSIDVQSSQQSVPFWAKSSLRLILPKENQNMSEKEWIQAEPDFVEKYEEWKKEQAQFGEIATKKSVYATNSPTPATNIMKNIK